MFTMSLDVVPPSIAYLNIGLIIGKLKIFVYTRIKYNIFLLFFSFSLCNLCVGSGVAVRSSQNNITDFLLPGKNLLLHTSLVDHVARWVFIEEKIAFASGPFELRLKGITSFSFYTSKLEKSCTIQIIPPRLKQTFKVCM